MTECVVGYGIVPDLPCSAFGVVVLFTGAPAAVGAEGQEVLFAVVGWELVSAFALVELKVGAYLLRHGSNFACYGPRLRRKLACCSETATRVNLQYTYPTTPLVEASFPPLRNTSVAMDR